jgi:ferrous iron transport protein A
MRLRGAPAQQSSVCGKGRVGRILKYDHSGRSFKVLPLRQPHGVRRLSILSELAVGESGILVDLDLPDSVQNHLMHMGFVPEARVTALRRAPAGDPTVYGIDGMEIALRRETAAAIRMRTAESDETATAEDADGIECIEAAHE